MNRLDFILRNIKPDDVDIVDYAYNNFNRNCYDDINRRIHFLTDSLSRLEREYVLLHEVCHSLTILPEWTKYRKYWETVEKPSNAYLCEYQAEKLLRQLCDKYGWIDILILSDDKIRNIFKMTNFEDPWGYSYMASQIIREEL